MTDDEECSKHRKPNFVSQTSKRSKLTLSVKNDFSVRASRNCETGLVFKGSLQDGLLQLSTSSVCECSLQNGKSCISCGTRASNLCVTDPYEDVISIKSDSEKTEINPACDAHSTSEKTGSNVDNTKAVKHKSDLDGDMGQDDKYNSFKKILSPVNSQSKDVCDQNCSVQATCHSTTNLPLDGVLRTEKIISTSSSLVGHDEILTKLNTEGSVGARKVEAWLHNTIIAKDHGLENDYDDGVGENAEFGIKIEQGVSEQKVTSEFFTDGDRQQRPVEGLQCPLCWKKLDKKSTSHLKLCATRHKVTTRQLLDALELQRKQVEERRALGLPMVSATAASKKSSVPRKDGSGKDANLQLALALSASLQEAEEREQDVLLESGMAEPSSLSPSVVQRQLSLLEKFGFTSSRPAVPSSRQKTSLSKARQKSYPLLNRTKEERERLITEKVAIVLMGEEDVEQPPSYTHDQWQDNTAVTSDLLLRCQDKGNQLWEMARETSADLNKELYYVQSLASHISPCKVEPGAKLKHLSQIEGRINTPKRSPDSKKIKLSGSPVISSAVKSSKCNLEEKMKKVKKLLDFSVARQSSQCTVKNSGKKKENAIHSSCLSEDWASVMNKQAMSDVTIHVGGGREIPAHKLVFYARCPALLYDLIKEESNGKTSELLMWVDVSYAAALAFLEFLYCGTMNRILHLGDDVSGLKKLAGQYQVIEIVQHLEVMHKVRAHVSNDGGYSSNASMNSTATKENSFIAKRSLQKANILSDTPNKHCLQDTKIPGGYRLSSEVNNVCTTPLDEKITPNHGSQVREAQCISPDMFDDECTTEDNDSECATKDNAGLCVTKHNVVECAIDELDDECTTECNDECTTEGYESQGSRVSVDCLLSLMNKGNTLGSDRNDEMVVISYASQSSNKLVAKKKKRKSYASSPSGSSDEVFREESSGSEKQKHPNIKKLSKKLLLENACPETNNNVGNTISFSQEKTLNRSRPEITMDLTPDSSDEEVAECKSGLIEESVCNVTYIDSTTPVGKDCGPTDSDVLLNSSICRTKDSSSSHSRKVGTETVGTELEALQNIDCGTNSEPDATFVDNVWDDFDDLGVVPNILFYSSPSRNHEILATIRTSARKSSSSISSLSPISRLSQDSASKNRENDKRQLKAGLIVGKMPSPIRKSAKASTSCMPETSGEADGDYKELLDDSLVDNWNSSALLRGECEEPQTIIHGSKADTPEESIRVITNKVTPLPDYSTMKTPLLKKELFRYGLKPLKRKHAKQILRHIYSELHPFVGKEGSGVCSAPLQPCGSQSSKSLFKAPGPDTVVPRSPGKRLSASPNPEKSVHAMPSRSPSPNKSTHVWSSASPSPKKLTRAEVADCLSGSESEDLSQASTCSSVSSHSSMAEEMILELESQSEAVSKPSEKDSGDFRSAVHQYIKSKPKLYEKILMYEPIWLEELHTELKAQKLKFNISQLMDYLDEQCVTFRTAQGQRSRTRKKERKRKSSSSVSQPTRGRPRKKACTQPS